MRILARFALSNIGMAAALLTGCGGSQPSISAPGALTQGWARASRNGSWMLPQASGDDLIYATGGCGGACVLSYPAGVVVGALSVGGYPSGDCSDSSGNVFITDSGAIYEFAHGGSSPIDTLSLPGNQALGCSIDPTTGNLAVVFAGTGANIAVFPAAAGTPTLYNSQIGASYCGYDNAGNLFVNGYYGEAYGFSELPSGGTTFTKLSIDQSVGEPGQVQWDGKYITYQGRGKNDAQVSRLSVSGSAATVVSTTHFKNIFMSMQSWIEGNRIFIPYVRHGNQGHPNRVGVWRYPKGGKATRNLSDFGKYRQDRDLQAVTFSAASSNAPVAL